MKYILKIKNIGKGEEEFTIRGDDGTKRLAEFSTKKAAQEACFIIQQLRTDAAFQYVRTAPKY